jgi:hypothetical protein
VQFVAPASEYKPRSQPSHQLALKANRPAKQLAQLASPASDTSPAPHAKQTVPFTLLYWPAGHSVAHDDAPSAVLTKPGGHVLQTDAPSAPCALL